jgi:hypothetical protein
MEGDLMKRVSAWWTIAAVVLVTLAVAWYEKSYRAGHRPGGAGAAPVTAPEREDARRDAGSSAPVEPQTRPKPGELAG